MPIKYLPLLVLALTTLLPAPAAAARTIRWILAHDRGNAPFAQLLEAYGQRLEEKSAGRLKLQIVPIPVKGPEHGNLDEIGLSRVMDGSADMSQLSVGDVKAQNRLDWGVLELPALFRGYEHAAAFFPSAVGKRLLASLLPASEGRIRAFAFTYSGGFRILNGRVPVTDAADLAKARLSPERGGPALQLLLKELGAGFAEKEEARTTPFDDWRKGRIDLEESEINRLAFARPLHPELTKQITTVNVTNHRMYLTAIVINEKFFSGLAPELQRVVADETERLAQEERRLSISLEQSNRRTLEKQGVRFVELSESGRGEFAAAAKRVHKRFPELASLIEEIQAVREDPKLTGL